MLLAGPILRRVESKSVNIWIALDEKPTVSLSLKESENNVQGTSAEMTFAIGSKLVIKLITFTPLVALSSGKVYSYDLRVGNNSLLKDLMSIAEGANSFPIGYAKDKLPSFALPATDQKNLVVAHGSCRKMHGEGPEALSCLDDRIKANLDKPNTRIQQLFLTGDQLYADEIPNFPMLSIMAKAKELISTAERLVWNETKVKHRVKKKDANGSPVLKEGKPVWEVGERTLSKAEIEPQLAIPGLRDSLLTQYAKMTTGSGGSHLLTFGEFCSAYLHAWTDKVWTDDLKNATNNWMVIEDNWTKFKELSGFNKENIIAREYLSPFSLEERDKWLDTKKDANGKELGLVAFEKYEENHKYRIGSQLKQVLNFLTDLPKVRRVLANTPTYMIFDDHEVTDDWNISQKWKDNAYGNPFGKGILRNALMSYALFQDLGNVPEEYRKAGTKKNELINAIVEYAKNPVPTANTSRIDALLGLMNATAKPEVTWHYLVESGSKVKTLFLDTRNQRGFPRPNACPAILSKEAFSAQFKFPTRPQADEILFVVSAVPAIGLSVFEELIYPLATSIKGLSKDELDTTAEARSLNAGQLDFDNEAWYQNSEAFEELLKQLSVFQRAVLFSGDVHYGFTTVLDYWKKEELQPSRFIQLVSSPLKNLWQKNVRLFQSGFIQGIFAGFKGQVEKFGWAVPPSVSGVDISMVNRRRLGETPAVIDDFGLQKPVRITPNPDWRYRLSVPIDERTDDKISNLPADLYLKDTFDHQKTADVRVLSERFEHNFRLGRSRRLMFASHVCMVSFENQKLKHTFLYRSSEDANTILEMVHEIALTPSVQEQRRPELPPVQ